MCDVDYSYVISELMNTRCPAIVEIDHQHHHMGGTYSIWLNAKLRTVQNHMNRPYTEAPSRRWNLNNVLVISLFTDIEVLCALRTILYLHFDLF